jgi:hypothetical protein
MVASAFCNYFYGTGFSTTTMAIVTPLLTFSVLAIGKLDKKWEVIPFGSNYVGGQVILAAYLVFLAVTFTTAVAVAASTRLGQVMTLLTCTIVLGLGVITDYAFGQHAGESTLAAAAYYVVPNIGPFWVIDGLMAASDQTTVTWGYVGYVTAYAALLTTATLGIAVAAFQKREVG